MTSRRQQKGEKRNRCLLQKKKVKVSETVDGARNNATLVLLSKTFAKVVL